jgi:succinate dehydrogenase/fumarate reductase cytochrome b subunit
LSGKPRETANVGAGLWKATGMWAWLLFRISGLILVFYLALVVAVLYHALNGVRIILMDFGIGVHRHKILFWSAMAVVVICFAIFAWVAFTYIVTGEGVTS